MTLERTSSGNGEIWKTSELSGDKPVAVKNVTVKNPVLLANVSNIMSSDKSYYLDVEWQEGTPERDKKLERFEQIIHRRNKRKLERERKAGDQPGLYDFAENNPHATVYGL